MASNPPLSTVRAPLGFEALRHVGLSREEKGARLFLNSSGEFRQVL